MTPDSELQLPVDRTLYSLLLGALLVAGCAAPRSAEPAPERQTVPLPTAGLAGQRVAVLPLTLLAAESELGWDSALADHRAALGRADSLVAALLTQRAPEVSWVLPATLRRSARSAPGVAADPDHLATSVLRSEGLALVPDPLRQQLRTLVALAGGRFALVPAAAVFRRTGGPADPRAVAPGSAPALGRAELSIVLVDGRTGQVEWRSVARGEGATPWHALTNAVKALTPGLP